MASHKIRNRKTNEIKEIKEDRLPLFLYGNIFGRIFARILAMKFISKISGWFMNRSISRIMIKNFIKNNHINMDDYPETKYQNFNEFFIREIDHSKRPIDKNKKIFISPADSKLTVYKINKASKFKIKDSYYKIEDLIKDDIYKEYLNGYCLIFRLCVDDYHRYCYIDDGEHDKPVHIKGQFHAVRPIVLDYYNIYKRNARTWTLLKTKNFNNIIHVEVGALNVGKIHNHHQKYKFKKGEEKGYFLFGASTVVLLVKENQITIDNDILEASKKDIETIVKYGEKIGIKKQD